MQNLTFYTEFKQIGALQYDQWTGLRNIIIRAL